MRASDRAYQSLRQDIIEGRLPPGTVLGEVEQSERLGLSRTPLREALSRLVADGLAEPSGGRGIVVTEVSLAEAHQLFDLRTVLEVLAARRAAENGDPTVFAQLANRFADSHPQLAGGADPAAYYALTTELDEEVDQACANPYLTQSLRSLRVHLARLRRLAQNDPARLAASALEHAAIARALASGNPEVAAAATTLHLHHAHAHLTARTEHPESTSTTTQTPRERTP